MKHPHARVALITGGSSGIGAATAKYLAESGWLVYAASRRPASAVSNIVPITLDVTHEDSVRIGVEQVLAASGRIDALINNAGFVVLGAFEESSVEQTRAIFDTNVFGAMNVTRAVMPAMRKQGAGRIVNISSIVGFLPAAYMGLYAASKHALEGFSESLDREVRGMGIRAILVEPAFTKTHIIDNTKAADRPIEAYRVARESFRRVVENMMGDAAEPTTVAEVVARALDAKAPLLRYTVGTQARVLSILRAVMPAKRFDASLLKNFKLDGQC
jgi:NAD(P)-dependent dehydrogenase (short-subunit alcohol dehydrogenase family)